MSNQKSITINQVYEPNYNQHKYQRPDEIFPDPTSDDTKVIDPLKSLATVLSQALSTKDQQSIRELLITADEEVIKNTVQSLSLARLHSLFQSIELVLLQETKNMANVKIVTQWVVYLLKKNIGNIVNNQQMQQTIKRISKCLKKREGNLQRLERLSQRIPKAKAKVERVKKVAKFHYIQQQNEIDHDEMQNENEEKEGESDISNIGEEDLQNLDEMLMQDDFEFDN